MLHDDKELFEQAVLLTSEAFNIDSGIIEKDYYVTMFLKELVKKQPNIIFKGGTSLSKCHKLIKRFSEDIDLTLLCDKRPTEGQRKQLKQNINSVINDFGFQLTNPDEVHSRRDYNKYIVDFPSVYQYLPLKQHLVVETSVFINSYPSQPMPAGSYLYDYFNENGNTQMIAQFGLEPFTVNVQTLERTFIDKIFALGDYYLAKTITEHSRHIYDLHKIYPKIHIDASLKALYKDVRHDRSKHAANRSAQDTVNMKSLLQEIIDKDIYKNDYTEITASLLYEKLPYDEAIQTLQVIVDSGLLD